MAAGAISMAVSDPIKAILSSSTMRCPAPCLSPSSTLRCRAPCLSFRITLPQSRPRMCADEPVLVSNSVYSPPARNSVVRSSGKPQPSRDFQTEVFKEDKSYDDVRKQFILKGGSHKLRIALKGIKKIGLIGSYKQVRDQAIELRKSLDGSGIVVKVGLPVHSIFKDEFLSAGFTKGNGTLGGIQDTIFGADLVLLFIPYEDQATVYEDIFSLMKPGSILGLSNGFLLSHLQSKGLDLPKDIGVISVRPEKIDPFMQLDHFISVGVNSSFTVHQDVNRRATDVALGWALAIGSPLISASTQKEYGEWGSSRGDLQRQRLVQSVVEQIEDRLYFDKLLNKDAGTVILCDMTGGCIIPEVTSAAKLVILKVEGTRDAESNRLELRSQDRRWDHFDPGTEKLWWRTRNRLFCTLNSLFPFLMSLCILVMFTSTRSSPSPFISSAVSGLFVDKSRDHVSAGAARWATSISLPALSKNSLTFLSYLPQIITCGMILYNYKAGK